MISEYGPGSQGLQNNYSSHDCTAAQRFKKLDTDRSTLLNEYERYAAITVPWVCTESGYTEINHQLQDDWDSFGHHAVTNLVNKMMLGLFSPAKPFFRLEASDQIRNALMEQGAEADLNQVFSKTEKACQRLMEKLNLRQPLTTLITNAAVIGTGLLKLDVKGRHRCYNIRRYVLQRNIHGQVIEFITGDKVKCSALDLKIRESQYVKSRDPEDQVCVYEWFKLSDDEKKWTSTTWVDEDKLPGKFDGGWKVEDFPYIFLTWNLPDEQNYGIGHVQSCIADLSRNSMLSQSSSELAASLSQHRWLVNPGSSTDPQDIQDSPNGAVIPGREGDLSLVSLGGKGGQLQVISAIQAEVKQNIATSFLMNSAMTRNAERVTAEEIRMQIRELETMLGGIYTRIANDLQLPLAYFLLKNIDEDSRLKVDGKDIQPVIITGVDALSRSGEVDNVMQMFNLLAPLNNLPPSLQQAVNMPALIKIIGAGLGVDTSQIILSDEQIAANQQIQMQAEMNGASGPQGGTAPTMV